MKITIFGEQAGLRKLTKNQYEISTSYWKFVFTISDNLTYKDFILLHTKEIEDYFKMEGVIIVSAQLKKAEKEMLELERLEAQFQISKKSWFETLYSKYF